MEKTKEQELKELLEALKTALESGTVDRLTITFRPNKKNSKQS